MAALPVRWIWDYIHPAMTTVKFLNYVNPKKKKKKKVGVWAKPAFSSFDLVNEQFDQKYRSEKRAGQLFLWDWVFGFHIYDDLWFKAHLLIQNMFILLVLCFLLFSLCNGLFL